MPPTPDSGLLTVVGHDRGERPRLVAGASLDTRTPLVLSDTLPRPAEVGAFTHLCHQPFCTCWAFGGARRRAAFGSLPPRPSAAFCIASRAPCFMRTG